MISRSLQQGGRRRFSASQVETYRTCPRKWAFRYVGGVQAPQHYSAKFGDRVHKIIEDYLEFGTMPDPLETLVLFNPRKGLAETFYPGRTVLAGLHYVPVPGLPNGTRPDGAEIARRRFDGGDVEDTFSLELANSLWTGRKDFRRQERDENLGIIVPQVWDWKTTGNVHADYVKTPDVLVTDAAAILYAADEIARFPGSEWVDLNWIYFQRWTPKLVTPGKTAPKKDEPKSRKIHLRIHQDQVRDGLVQLDEEGYFLERMRESGLHPNQYPANPRACPAFGGCPYVDTPCILTEIEKVEALMSTGNNWDSMLAAKAAQAGIGAPPPVPGAVPPPVISPPPVAPAVPKPHDALAAAMADGWLYHPNSTPTAMYYYRGTGAEGQVLEFSKLVDMYPAPSAPQAPALPPVPPTAPPVPALHTGINPPENPGTHVANELSHPNATAPREETAFPGAENAGIPTAAAAGVTTDQYDLLDREALKNAAVSRGLCEASTKSRETTLRKLLRDADAKAGVAPSLPTTPTAPTAPPAPPVPPPVVQAPAAPPVPPAPPQAPPVPPMAPSQAAADLSRIAPMLPGPTAPPVPLDPRDSDSFVLLVNVRTAKGLFGRNSVDGNDHARQAAERVAAGMGLAHYKLVDYGKGPGLLAAELENALRPNPFRGQIVSLDTTTDLGRDALEVFSKYASTVLRGF